MARRAAGKIREWQYIREETSFGLQADKSRLGLSRIRR
jgi:hypothetical protein